jgi:hypothetical protein
MVTEEKFLESVYQSRMTLPEFSQFIERQLNELESNSSLLTDAPLRQQITEMRVTSNELKAAILLVQKSSYTSQLAALDQARDRAFVRYVKVLKTFSWSDNPAEFADFEKLSVLQATYNGVERLNYEAESSHLSKLVTELEGSVYSEAVTRLGLKGYVESVKSTNQAFNQLFDSRSFETANKLVYDTQVLRKILQKQYDTFAGYTLSMAKVLGTEPFITVLKTINSVRVYYGDMLKRSEGVKTAANDKAENSIAK